MDEAQHTHATDTPQNGDGEAHIKALLASYDARIASLERMLSEANEARASGDSIIMQLSLTLEKQQSQLQDQTLLLEDLRGAKRSWRRLFQRRKSRSFGFREAELAESAT